MRMMRNWFLRARHWQLFLLFVVFPMAAQFTVIVAGGSRLQYWYFGVMGFWAACVLGWFASVGTFCSAVIREMRGRVLFYFGLLYPIVYTGFFVWWATHASKISAYVILPGHLLCMFCIGYEMYFVSRMLVSAESGTLASFASYAPSLALLYFYPLGVWVLQPRINKLFAGVNRSDSGVL